MSVMRGRTWCFGDDIGSELIMPARYTKHMAPDEMAKHVMEGVDPGFVGRISKGDFVVGGQNFGHGTSREQAAFSLQRVGIAAVIAPTFGRIFYRNCMNLGLPALRCVEAHRIRQGDELEVDLEAGSVTNLTQGDRYDTIPFSGPLLSMLRAGGLLAFIEGRIQSGEFRPAPPPSGQ